MYWSPIVNNTYQMSFQSNGNMLKLSINNIIICEVEDNNLKYGTTGVRTDYVDIVFYDWQAY